MNGNHVISSEAGVARAVEKSDAIHSDATAAKVSDLSTSVEVTENCHFERSEQIARCFKLCDEQSLKLDKQNEVLRQVEKSANGKRSCK